MTFVAKFCGVPTKDGEVEGKKRYPSYALKTACIINCQRRIKFLIEVPVSRRFLRLSSRGSTIQSMLTSPNFTFSTNTIKLILGLSDPYSWHRHKRHPWSDLTYCSNSSVKSHAILGELKRRYAAFLQEIKDLFSLRSRLAPGVTYKLPTRWI